MASFHPFLPQFSCRHLLIMAVFLFYCFGCHADDAAPMQLSNYDCATKAKKVNGFNVLDGGLMIGSTDLPKNGPLPLFGYQTKEKFEAVMVVPTGCHEAIQKTHFMIGQINCNKSNLQKVAGSKKCPASGDVTKKGDASSDCKAFTINCDVITVPVKEDTSGRLFKIDLKDIQKATSASCTKWSLYIDGVRLVLESKGSGDGEACASGGLAVWVIVLIVVGVLFGLLAVIGGVVALLIIRRRQAAQPAVTPAAAEANSGAPWTSQQQSKMGKTGEPALAASASKGDASNAKTKDGIKTSYAAVSRTAAFKLDMPKKDASKIGGASTGGVSKKP